MAQKQTKSPDDFWREYEETTGEKVLARSLGQYISGWEEFDRPGGSSLWGLVIATSGGFRFHHFPQANWLAALFSFSGAEAKEQTIFIPKDRIISAKLRKETRLWKKLLSPSSPELDIHYQDDAGEERKLLFRAGYKSDDLAETIEGLKPSACQCISADSV